MDKDQITLIAPKIRGFSGTASYVDNVIKGLTTTGLEFHTKYVSKKEISLFGKPFFGIFYQFFMSRFITTSTPIVHALSPEVVTRKTNIVTIHDIIPFTNPQLYLKTNYDKVAYNLAFKRALTVDNLLVSTHHGKVQLLNHIKVPEERVHVVYHCIDHSKYFYDSSSPYKGERINVVMLSDYNPRKRIDKIVEILKNDKEIDFYHIGPNQNWKANFDRVMKISDGASNIHLLGPMSTDVTRKYLSNADLFVYLSEDEGFGYPILEALACGTKVLVSKIPVFEELLAGIASFVDIGSLSRDIFLEALKAGKTKEQLQDYSQKFSRSKMAEDLNNIYSTILDKL